jgi:ATP-binding cassette subfamily C protein
VKEAIRYFIRAYPGRSAITVACLVAAAAVEGFGLAALVPMLGLTIQGDAAAGAITATSGLESTIRDLLAAIGVPFTLFGVASLFVTLMWIKAGVMMLANRQVGNTVAYVATDLRLQVLRSLLVARWSYYTRQPLGRITNAVATEANRAAESYHSIALATQHGLLTILAIGFAFYLSWPLALAAVVGGVAIGVTLDRLVRLSGRVGERQTHLTNSLMSRLSDTLMNVRLLRATGRERLIGPLLEKDTRQLGDTLRSHVLLEEILKALQEPLVMMLLISLLVYAHAVVGLGFERISVLLFALTRALVTATKVQRRFQLAAAQHSALASIRTLIEGAEAAADHPSGTREPRLKEGVRLSNVHLAYDSKPVLTGLDLEIPAGRITALIGASGGGKSTLIDLVTGLARPDSGSVCIDGTPLDEIDLATWRAHIGYVPQEVVLFHDSVRMNVTLGDPTISDEDAVEALQKAGVWDVVAHLPGELDANVGERGALLSGGQRARIALARALAYHPELLILDEATASLDPETEVEIWDTLVKLRGKLTILAVSHQPALAGAADHIHRIGGGVATAEDSAEPGSI